LTKDKDIFDILVFLSSRANQARKKARWNPHQAAMPVIVLAFLEGYGAFKGDAR